MESINIFDSIIPLVETISSSYKTIQRIEGLPEAFFAVRNRLPLAEETFYLLQEALESGCKPWHEKQSDLQHFARGIDDCSELLDFMNTILHRVTAQAEGTTNWSGVIDPYRKIVMSTGKGENIENLVLLLLDKLKRLLLNDGIRDYIPLSGQRQKLELASGSLIRVLQCLPASDSEIIGDNAFMVKECKTELDSGPKGPDAGPNAGSNPVST